MSDPALKAASTACLEQRDKTKSALEKFGVVPDFDPQIAQLEAEMQQVRDGIKALDLRLREMNIRHRSLAQYTVAQYTEDEGYGL